MGAGRRERGERNAYPCAPSTNPHRSVIITRSQVLWIPHTSPLTPILKELPFFQPCGNNQICPRAARDFGHKRGTLFGSSQGYARGRTSWAGKDRDQLQQDSRDQRIMAPGHFSVPRWNQAQNWARPGPPWLWQRPVGTWMQWTTIKLSLLMNLIVKYLKSYSQDQLYDARVNRFCFVLFFIDQKLRFREARQLTKT